MLAPQPSLIDAHAFIYFCRPCARSPLSNLPKNYFIDAFACSFAKQSWLNVITDPKENIIIFFFCSTTTHYAYSKIIVIIAQKPKYVSVYSVLVLMDTNSSKNFQQIYTTNTNRCRQIVKCFCEEALETHSNQSQNCMPKVITMSRSITKWSANRWSARTR